MLLKKAAPAEMPTAVARVNEACRGRYRRALRDHPAILKAVQARSQTGPVASRKAVLDTHRCFSIERFRSVLRPLFAATNPELVAYAAEVAARTEDSGLVEALLAALEARRSGCAAPGQSDDAVDVCVWLTYAPGACLGAASRTLRAQAGQAAAGMLTSPYAKVREVAVETLASARLKRFAPAVATLIKQEKAGAFDQPNTGVLVARFEQRRRRLARGE